MRYREIEFYNFRQYRGHQKVKFSIDPKKPLTVILGQNTSGKTTFVRAFTWCLYGGKPEDFGFKANSLFLNENEQVALEQNPNQNSKEASVTLIVDSVRGNESTNNPLNKQYQYRIVRKQNYYFDSADKKIKIVKESLDIYQQAMINGHADPSENEILISNEIRKKQIINSIIPKNLSEYFFYWGEKIVNIGNRSDIKNAIESITGLDLYAQAQAQLKDVQKAYKESEKYQGDEILKKIQDKKREIKSEIDKEKEVLEENRKNYEIAEKRAEEAEVEYYKLTDTEKNIFELKKLRDERSTIEDNLKDSYNKFHNVFTTAKQERSIAKANRVSEFYVYEKAGKLLEMVKRSREEEDTIGWAKISADMIQEILDRGVCICGQKLSEHPELIAHLNEQLPLAIPNNISGYVGEVEGIYDSMGDNVENYLAQLFDLRKSYNNMSERLESLNNEIEYYEKINVDENEYQRVKREKIDTAHIKQKAFSDINQTEKNIQALQADWKKADIDFNRELGKTKQYERDKARLDFTKKLIDYFKCMEKKGTESIRERLKHYAQKYFDEMYQGNRRIDFTKTFIMRVYNTVDGVEREDETSPGLETVKNFAFVAALITIAKEMSKKQNIDDVEAAEPYPLVLDAPFSQADEIHILNICKMLVQLAEQTILVVMEKDWKVAQYILGPKMGEGYIIEKESETLSKIKMVDLQYGG